MSDPAAVSRLIHDLAGRLGMDASLDVGKLFSRWEEIVGQEVAAKCRPMKLRAGVLRIEATSQAWAAELRYLAPKLIEAINAGLGKAAVREIRAVVSRTGLPASPSRQPNDRLGTNIEPSNREVREAQEMTAVIPDKRLAEAAKRALLAAKMRKKQGGPRGIL